MANRVVCCLAVSLLMGILFGKYGDILILSGFLLFLLSVSIAIFKNRKDVWKIVLFRSIFCCLFFCLGFGHFREELQQQNRLEAVLKEGKQLTVQGKVQKREERTEQYLYYLTDTKALVDGIIYPSYGVLVYSSNQHIQPGNILRTTGAYASFQISRNEGNFNEKQYYQSKKIEFRLYAQDEIVISGQKDPYLVLLGKVRQNFRDVYLQCMTEKNAGLLADMTLGDKTLLDGEIKSLYQQAGISHILAISGLHISLFGMGVYRLLQRLFCPNKICALLSVGVVYSFGLLSGMEISTVRAIVMFCIGMAARILGYSYDSPTALGASFLIQIWENPFLLEHTGFLFSYSAVLGVTVIAKILRKPFCQSSREASKEHEKSKGKCLVWKKWLKKRWETIYISGCIQLATLPLSLYFYYELPCYSILTNGCILPLMGPLLFLSVLGVLLGSIFLPAGKLILTPAGWMLAGSEWVCRKILNLPGAVFLAGKPEIMLILLYYGVLIAILYLLWHGGKKWLAGVVLAFGMVLLLREKPQFEINVLDVGQGDGIFIQTEEGEHFFVDGGSSDVKQVGAYRILPFLKAKGIASVKGWMVSHADQDHISGLVELLEEGYPIEYLIVADGMVRDEASKELLHMAKKAGCKVIFAIPGMKFGTQSTIFTVWYPKAKETEEKRGNAKARDTSGTNTSGEDRNGASLVVSLEHWGFTGILTGDIGVEEEQQITKEHSIEAWMTNNCIESIDFYKGAHHGSNGSNSQEFLEVLSPKLAVISCGEGNSYGHPGTEAMERLKSVGGQILCTMDNGQVTIRVRKGQAWVWTFL